MDLAPILIFTYSRLSHTISTIQSLQKNIFANESDLFIFSDGPKNEGAVAKVNELRKYLRTIDGFKKVEIIERKNNFGLAQNIISGVTDIINKYGKAIIIEDDIVTGKYFLSYMNEALQKFQNEKKVWHITGWRDPIESVYPNSAFFYPTMDCWGWATWADRWRYFEKNPQKLKKQFNRKMKKQFNIEGADPLMFLQIEKNISGEINTWAIFWYATIFLHNGLCLGPTKSLVKNIGFDNSGENCRSSNEQKILDSVDIEITNYPQKIEINFEEYNKNIQFIKRMRRKDFTITRFIFNKLPGNLRKTIKDNLRKRKLI